MKDIGRQVAFIQRKVDHLDNDLFKLIISDFYELVSPFKNSLPGYKKETNKLLEELKSYYKGQMRNLRNEEKRVSRQIDLEDSIREIKQYPVKVEEAFCGHKDCPLLQTKAGKINDYGTTD